RSDVRREDREHAFHAFAIRDLADGEVFHDAGAGAGNHDAFIGLQTFLVAFADLDPDLDGVAMGEFGDVALCSEFSCVLGVELFDNVHFRSVRSFHRSDSFGPCEPRRPVLVGNGRAVFLVLLRSGSETPAREWAAHRRNLLESLGGAGSACPKPRLRLWALPEGGLASGAVLQSYFSRSGRRARVNASD